MMIERGKGNEGASEQKRDDMKSIGMKTESGRGRETDRETNYEEQ